MKFYQTLALAALAGLVAASPIAIEDRSIAARSDHSLAAGKREAQSSGLVGDDDFDIPDEPDTKRDVSFDDDDDFNIPDEPDTKRDVSFADDDFEIPDEPDTKRDISFADDDFEIADEPDTKRAVTDVDDDADDDFEIPDEPDN